MTEKTDKTSPPGETPAAPPMPKQATDQTADLIALSDQVILLGADWSDTRGFTAKLQFTGTEDGSHPLKAFTKGTRFHMVLVEVANDEEPVNQKLKKKLEDQLQDLNKGGRWSNNCGILCKGIDFHRYLFTIGKMHAKWDQKTKETMAREYVLDMLKIKSRREIDHSEDTAAAYQNLILDPFYAWERDRAKSKTR